MYRVIEVSKGRYEILFVGSFEDCENYARKLNRKVYIEKDFLWLATHFYSGGGVKNPPENPK